MRYSFVIFFLVCCTISCKKESVKKKETRIKTEEEAKIDFSKNQYKYLDNNYKILINSKEFDSIAYRYEYDKNRITRYKDSLSVVLIGDFKGDWKKANKETFRISYTWERLSYHLWLNIDETKQFAEKFNFNHPYLFKQFLLTSSDKKVESFFNNLKGKIKYQIKNSIELDTFNREQVLDFAMRNNESRIKGYRVKSHRH